MLDPVRIRLVFDDSVRSYPVDPNAHVQRHDAERWLGETGHYGLAVDGDHPRRSLILAGDNCDCGIE